MNDDERESLQQLYAEHVRASFSLRTQASILLRDARAHDKVSEGLRELNSWLAPEPPEGSQESMLKPASEITRPVPATAVTETLSAGAPAERSRVVTTRRFGVRRVRGTTAVEQLLASAPGKYFTSQELANEMIRRGWLDDTENERATVRAAVNRSYSLNNITKRRRDSRTMEYAMRVTTEHPHRNDNDPAGAGSLSRQSQVVE